MMTIAFTTVPSYSVPATNPDYAIVNTANAVAVPVAQPTGGIPRSAFLPNTDKPSTLLPTFNTANPTTPTALFGAVPTTTPKYVTVVATPAPRQATGLDATSGITQPLLATTSNISPMPADLSSLSGLNGLSSLPDASLSSTNTDALTALLGRNTMSAVPTAGNGTGLDTNALTGLLANAFNASSPRSVVAENPSTADTAIIKDKLDTLQDALRELKAQPPVSNTTEPAPKPIIASTTPRSVALEPSTDENNNNNNNKKKMTEKKNEVGKNQKGIKKPSNTDVN